MNDIPEWYERVLYKKALARNIHLLKDRKAGYRIDYLLTKKAIDSNLLELIHLDDTYYLYKVKS
jgi:hypothetical protein